MTCKNMFFPRLLSGAAWVLGLLVALPLWAQSEPAWIAELLDRSSFHGVTETAIGVTRLETPSNGGPIVCFARQAMSKAG